MVFMLVFMNITIYSQTTSSTIFTNGDIIRIEISKNSDYIYLHQIEKGQSIYGLSKIFKVPISQLYELNNLSPNATISIGQQIKIPVSDGLLYKGASLSGVMHGHYIPVYYQVRPKDNLFRISRVYFDQSTEDLVRRNNFVDNNLSLGQNVLIGWFPIQEHVESQGEDEFVEDFEDDIENLLPETLNLSEDTQSNDGLGIISNTQKNDFRMNRDSISFDEVNYPDGFNMSLLGSMPYSDNMEEVKKSEVANWDKSMPDNGTVFVLHRNAIIDTYVEMYNPTMKRSVRAKVIGRIPYGAYTDNVTLVLSPRAAKQLRALDNRFKVEVKMLVDSNS